MSGVIGTCIVRFSEDFDAPGPRSAPADGWMRGMLAMTHAPVRTAFLIGCSLLAFAAIGHATDWIRLKDGVQIYGEIVLKTDREVTLQSERGLYTFDLRRVAEIHQMKPRQIRNEADRESSKKKPTSGPGAPSSTRNLDGSCTIDVPWSFRLTQARKELPDGSRIMIGLEEPSTGAQIMVTASPRRDGQSSPVRPVNADFSAIEKRIREGIAKIPNARLDTLERTRHIQHEALLVSLWNPNFDPPRRGLQLYIDGPDRRVYQVTIGVPEDKFQLNSKRYLSMLRSLRFPKQPSSDNENSTKTGSIGAPSTPARARLDRRLR